MSRGLPHGSIMSPLVVGLGPAVPNGFMLMDELEALPIASRQDGLVSQVEFLAACQASLGVEAVKSLKIYHDPMLFLRLHQTHAPFSCFSVP